MGASRGGARGLSQELSRRQKGAGQLAGEIKVYWKLLEPSIKGDPLGKRLRMERASEINRIGPKSCGAFCSPRSIWTTRFLMGKRMTMEGNRPICLALPSVISMIITANATTNPVHLLQQILVTLRLAKCTSRTSARPMPRAFSEEVLINKRLEACRKAGIGV